MAEIEPSLNDKLQVVARFRGRPFNPEELSKGELILAVWAIILHRQKEDLRGAYLLVDEPENHLHPDVCIRAPRFLDPNDRSECIKHIQGLGQPGEPETYLVDTLERFTVPDAERMDLVVMCNVLHELHVGGWQHSFECIHHVLADDGHLVIFEDQTPSIGELPHADGYVILNEPALQHLFGSKNAVMLLSPARGEKLTAFAVPRTFLKKVTPETIGKALGSVKRMAEERIRSIRDRRRNERSFQDGRQHAHFALLYANAHLASQQFPEPEERSAPPRTA